VLVCEDNIIRILHLAYEDPKQPGSGGGSIRTLEINRRLASNHDITAVVSGYKGAVPRYEQGIHWIPLGTKWNYTIDKLSYFGLLWTKVVNTSYDLIVEDFGPPFAMGFTPLFANKPVVASVQWLFASEMAEKYHLPVQYVEQFGLQFYTNFITVSNWLSDLIRTRCRHDVLIESIANGIEEEAFTVETNIPQHFIFVGRLDIAQKGCDLLIQAVIVAKKVLQDAMPKVLIVGDGPDEPEIKRLISANNLVDSFVFMGRVIGTEKYQLMADAYAVLMPSRFETFGMVAAEAQASGAPVITFDVGPLREVAGGGGGIFVPAFDVELFAKEMIDIVHFPEKSTLSRKRGRIWAQRYNWNAIALRQEAHYLGAIKAYRHD